MKRLEIWIITRNMCKLIKVIIFVLGFAFLSFDRFEGFGRNQF